MKNRELAFSFYRMAVTNSRVYRDHANLSTAFLGMARMFRDAGNIDSSIVNAEFALSAAQVMGHKESLFESGKLLSELYQDRDQSKAFRYLSIAMQAKDSAFSKEKQMQIANMTYAAEERQRDNTARMLKADTERKANLQYAGIGVVLLAILILFFVYSHSIIANQKLISFFGVIALLMVFEFLNLLLHPWLGAITHHSPVLMLLAMALVAALLIPLHHKLEHWIKHRLVEKSRKIKLTAAKKIISELKPGTDS
jgi:hypothetical protein